MVNIAVLVSGGGTNLQAILDAQARGDIHNGRVSVVVSSNDKAYALERAKQAGVPGVVRRKKDYASGAEYCRALASLIPSFCGDGFYGLHVHEAALAKGVKVTGATVHFVNAITDGGPIIAQKAVAVEPDDTPEILQKRVMAQAEHILLPRAVSLFCEGKLSVSDSGIVSISE